jgi:hypothetical protein
MAMRNQFAGIAVAAASNARHVLHLQELSIQCCVIRALGHVRNGASCGGLIQLYRSSCR